MQALTTKLGWLVKIKSIHKLELESMCVGSDISWSNLCNDVSASKCVTSVVVLSSFHQAEDLGLKSPKIIVSKQFYSKAHQSQTENFQIQYCLGLETCRQHQYILYNFARKLHKQCIKWG